MLSAKWGTWMKQWTYWEWMAYGALWIAATVIALDTSFKLTSGQLRVAVAGLLDSPAWGFSPLFFVIAGTAILIFRPSSKERSLTRNSGLTTTGNGPAAIEICFEKRAPYEVCDIQQGRVLSTVRIGIRNTGRGVLSNCRVFVEKISPPPHLSGGDGPRQLADSGFTVRWDDPEKFVDVATHWDHVNQYRFNTPLGWWAETLNFLEDTTPRTIVIKAEAFECQRSASFKLWTDAEKALHLDYIGYVN
jgi:hypothetical protein